MPVKSSPTSAVQKACRVLCALTDPQVRRMSDIADATQLHKVSVLRILETLCEEGLVRRDPATKQYHFGPESYVIGAALSAQQDLRSVARPSVCRLAESTGDTVTLIARVGFSCVCLDRETGSFPIHATPVFVGSRRRLGIGSGPMAVLAWLEPGEREAALRHIKPVLRKYPGVSERYLRQSIDETRERGYSLVKGEIVSDIGGIAMVIPDPQGRPLGALSVSSISRRIVERKDMLAQLLSKEVALIRDALEAPA